MAGYVLSAILSLVLSGLLIACIAVFLCYRIDRRGFTSLGLNIASPGYVVAWSFAGVIAASPLLLSIVFNASVEPRAVARGAAVLLPASFVQAASEEIVFRGIVLASLAARYGVRVGMLGSALLFGAWHLQIGQSPVDAIVAFGSTFVFGITAAIATLHYANLGPAIALHAIWNLAIYLHGGSSGGEDFFAAWLSAFYHQWTWTQLINGELGRYLLLPLFIESLLVFAACRDTVLNILGLRVPDPL
ncbi:MAG: lysostaphin resistance A-like protein [Hyphomonadaceae bacterium]